MFLRDLRRAVEAYCEKHGITQATLAERAGILPSALSRALAPGREEDEVPAEHTVRLNTVEKIVDAIEMRLALEKKSGGER